MSGFDELVDEDCRRKSNVGWRFCWNIESSRSLGHSAEDVLLSGAQQRGLFWRCKLEAQQQTGVGITGKSVFVSNCFRLV